MIRHAGRRRPLLKIYGERNTGTNYLSGLLRSNTDAVLLSGTAPARLNRVRRRVTDSEAVLDLWLRLAAPWNLGWKHRRVDIAELDRRRRTRRVGFVVLVKNPYSWLVSLQRRPYHRTAGSDSPTIAELATEPWPTRSREGGPDVYDNAVVMWNDKASSYLELAARLPTTIVRYEDLVTDPEATVRLIVERTGLRLLDERVWNIERSTKRDGRSFEDFRSYYTEERWRDAFGPGELRAVNRSLDADIAAAFGYVPVSSEAAVTSDRDDDAPPGGRPDVLR